MLTSLRSRNVALLVVVVLAGQLLSFVLIWALAIRPQAERVGEIMARNVAAISMTMESLDGPARDRLAARINAGGAIRILPGNIQPPEDRGIPTMLERLFIRAFAREMQARDVIIWRGGANGQLWVRVPMGGQPMWVAYERPKGWTPNGALFASFLIAVTMALIGGLLLQRRIAQPLKALAVAADTIQPDGAPAPLPTDGPDEIAAVARSFNAMATRLSTHEADRRFMLAGISHDLRTPLAKVRLAIAMIPGIDSETDTMLARQFDRIDVMLGQFLDFARGIENEAPSQVDLAALAGSVAQTQDAVITVVGPSELLVTTRAAAIERAVSNLVRNALLYGRPPTTITLSATAASASITVSDDGDGIDQALLASIDQPFVRGDAARASDGGTGLGLAIVRHVAEATGGHLVLRNRTGGGFDATLSLPIDANQND